MRIAIAWILLGMGAAPKFSFAAVFIWQNASGGGWDVPSNWDRAAFPNGRSHTADFSQLSLSADPTVTLNNNRDIGHLVFGDQDGSPNNWTLTGSILYLGPSSGQGSITVNNGVALINNRINTTAPAGLTGITKLGQGTLQFGYTAGQNTYGSGGLVIQEGTVQYAYNHPNPFAKGVVWNGGTLAYGFGGLAQGGTFTVDAGGGTLDLTGSTDYRFNTLNQLRGAGTLLVKGGDFWISANQNLFTGTLNVQGAGAMVTLQSTALASGTVNLGANGRLRTYDASVITLGRLTGTGSVISRSGVGTLTVGDDGASPFTFGGTLNGSLNFIKEGDSTMTVSADQNYTGTTTVNGGKLIVNGTHTGNGAYIVNSGGRLAGVGTISGSTLTIKNGGVLEPGNGIGIINVPNLALAAGSTVIFQIKGITAAGVDFDVVKGSALNYNGPWNLVLNFLDYIPGPNHSIQIFDFASYNGAAAPTIYLQNSRADNVSYDNATGYLTFSDAVPLPEPSTLLLVMAGEFVFLMRRSRGYR